MMLKSVFLNNKQILKDIEYYQNIILDDLKESNTNSSNISNIA